MDIQNKYKALSELDHILFRPGMYIGSTKMEQRQMFVYSSTEEKMEQQTVDFIPGMLKMIDEVISNSVDEYRRSENMGLTNISVDLYKDGTVIVKDNGGIPVVIHSEYGCYIPELIFGRFRTSSNYDDDEDRNVIGTNGVGAKLANIFSTEFSIYTADKKNSYFQQWRNNMRDKVDEPEIQKNKDHFTQTSFKIDFSKFDEFESNELPDSFAAIIEKRCIDAAAANPGLEIEFGYFETTFSPEAKIHSIWKFGDFSEYIALYEDYVDQENGICFGTEKQKVWVYPDGNINIGFVNGAECSEGTHIQSIRYDINNVIAKKLNTAHKIEVSTKAINSKYSLFCIVDVRNPAYDSQTKEKLITSPEKFGNDGKKYIIPKTFLDDVAKSEIIQIVLDWFKQKTEAENSKETRRINKSLKNKVRNDKFIDANSRNRRECELWIFEGASAKSGFRLARTPQTQGSYMLRGVIKNTITASQKAMMQNTELHDLVSILGLQFGVRNDTSKLNFGRIVICTDMDHDGDKIAGLLFVFFNTHFPELIEDGIVCRALSPIITATKAGDVKDFYTFIEYKEAEKNLTGYHIKYTKGLGGLAAAEYKKMMQSPKFHFFKKDELANDSIKTWFGDDAYLRKQQLSADV